MSVVADMSNVIDEEIWEKFTAIVFFIRLLYLGTKRQLFLSETYLARAETFHLISNDVTDGPEVGGLKVENTYFFGRWNYFLIHVDSF